jgi:septum formation protein
MQNADERNYTFHLFEKMITSGAVKVLIASLFISRTSAFSTRVSKIGTRMTRSNNALQSSTNPLTDLNLPSPLILGSGSFTRKLILKEMNIPFEIKTRSIDERAIGDRTRGSNPKELVLTLGKAKADHLVQGLMDESEEDETLKLPHNGQEWIVLTADQVVTHSGSILEKPDDLDQAKDFVSRYASSPPSTVGSVVLTHLPSLIQVSGVDSTQINFTPSVSECNLIERLVEEGAPVLKCAGGLMVEHPLVKEHIKGIDGTEDSVMGLSKSLVIRLLEELKEKLQKEN